jgi:hypothetical protein
MQPNLSNIEIFNRICLQLLSELYESFPVPIVVEPNALAISAIPKDSSFNGAWDAIEISTETIFFLQQEGFLSIGGTLNTGESHDVRLTMKGLAVLGSVPVSLKKNDPREPLITKIGKLLGVGVEKAATEAVQSAMSEVFKLALSSCAVVATNIMKA